MHAAFGLQPAIGNANAHDGDQFVEVEIDDRLQSLTGSALLKVSIVTGKGRWFR
jgi:hypothetical protein